MQDDYQAYLNGGGSMYGVFVKTKQTIEKSNISNKQLNLMYIDLIINRYLRSIKSLNSKYIPLQKIFIPDEDYTKLTKEIKKQMSIYNLITN